MTIVPASIKGWSGYEITQGDVVLGLVPDLGGRIMSLRFRGEELLYIPDGEDGQLPDLSGAADIDPFKAVFGFRIFGGDKTWVAPERAWRGKTPPVDLDAGRYAFEQRDGFAVMTSPVCRETGLQIIRRVGFMDNGDVCLSETLRNMAGPVQARGIWNVTQIRKPFDVFLPSEEGAVRSYHHEDATLPDPGFLPFYRHGWAIIPCQGAVCYKFGGHLREGRAAVMKQTPLGRVIFARVFDIAPGEPYAHHSMAEVFNAPDADYGEIEVHSPLKELAPGAEMTLTQLWRVCQG